MNAMDTIRSRHPGEWTCTECDRGHNGWLPTQTWWRSGPPPKICWRCVQKGLASRSTAFEKAFYLSMALTVEGNHGLSRDDIRKRLDQQGINPGYSNSRLAAGVHRLLNKQE